MGRQVEYRARATLRGTDHARRARANDLHDSRARVERTRHPWRRGSTTSTPRPSERRQTRTPMARGFGSTCRSDGYDGDDTGSQFWAVWHGPKGEAPFSAPQAKKILGPKCRFTEF